MNAEEKDEDDREMEEIRAKVNSLPIQERIKAMRNAAILCGELAKRMDDIIGQPGGDEMTAEDDLKE